MMRDNDLQYLKKYLPKELLDEGIKQLEKEQIQPSDEEKKKILDAYCGYTTWQDIKAVLPNVQFKTKEEINLS